MKILVVEDDEGISSLLKRALSEEGHLVIVAADLAQAHTQLLEHTDLQLLIVDRMLPDGDGLSLIQDRGPESPSIPSICLTARGRTKERVEGLYAGADDYITKPFELEELLARVTAVTRRTGGATGMITVHDLEVDMDALRVWRDKVELHLTAQEFKLLRFLVENKGRVVPRSRILQAVWDTTHDPGTNVVEVYISYLRAKVDRGHKHALIQTVRGIGYLLEGPE